MPAGVAHRRIAGLVVIATVMLIAAYYDALVQWLGTDPVFEYTLLFCCAFLVGTYLLSPDLDLVDSDPTRSWGIFQTIWAALRDSISASRGVPYTRDRNADTDSLSHLFGLPRGSCCGKPYGLGLVHLGL